MYVYTSTRDQNKKQKVLCTRILYIWIFKLLWISISNLGIVTVMTEFVNLTTARADAAKLRADGDLEGAVQLMKKAVAADPKSAELRADLRALMQEHIARLQNQQTKKTDPRQSTDPKARKMTNEQMTAAAMIFLQKPQFAAMPKAQADAYLLSKGLPEHVLKEARRRINQGQSPPHKTQNSSKLESKIPHKKIGSDDGNKIFGTGMHAPKIMIDTDGSQLLAKSSSEAVDECDGCEAGKERIQIAQGISCKALVSLMDEEDSKSLGKNKKRKKYVRKKIKLPVEMVAKDLHTNRWAMCEDFIPPSIVQGVREEMSSLEFEYEASEIWVGKDKASVGAMLQVPSVRGDKVLWMCGGHLRADNQRDKFTRKLVGAAGSTAISLAGGAEGVGKLAGKVEPCDPRIRKRMRTNDNVPPHMKNKIESGGVTQLKKEQLLRFDALQKLLSWIDRLVVGRLKHSVPELANIRERSDAMLAIYPGNGARFQRHIDNTASDGRKLTVLCYLNPGWDKSQGGALRINPAKSPPVDVAPKAGRIAMFFADEVMHEVLPSYSDRHAITVWYYDSNEYQAAVERSARNPPPAADSAISLESKDFMQLIVDETLDAPIAMLSERVDALSDGALKILAGITSAPTTDDFKGAIKGMTHELLLKLRKRFKSMGF